MKVYLNSLHHGKREDTIKMKNIILSVISLETACRPDGVDENRKSTHVEKA